MIGLICSSEKVIENVEISDGIYKLSIKGKFESKPGQFYMLKAWKTGPLLPRPISVYDLDDEKITFLYQVVGTGTELLANLRKDDDIQIVGPLGNGFDVNEIKGKVAVVTGGIGIAPMNYLVKQIENCDVDFYAGFRNVDYSVDCVEKYVNKIQLSTENGSVGHKGYITEILNPEEYDLVLCCGPEIMMKKVVKMCNEKNVPIYVSMENKMACGVGACLVCTCKTKDGNKRTCKDGPVFKGEELELDD